jgi:hypothetical protein
MNVYSYWGNCMYLIKKLNYLILMFNMLNSIILLNVLNTNPRLCVVFLFTWRGD